MDTQGWQTKLLLFLLIALGCMAQLQAQNRIVTKFKCENFYSNGITEFIELVQENNEHQFYYFTSQDSKKVLLRILDKSKTTQYGGGEQYKVQFSNQEGIFMIVLRKGGLLYIHPQGREQSFCIVGLNCD